VILTDGEPRGLAVQSDKTTFLATINGIKVLRDKTLLADLPRPTGDSIPSAIVVHPSIPGEFVVGTEVPLHKPYLT
jgi:hypothetical protein